MFGIVYMAVLFDTFKNKLDRLWQDQPIIYYFKAKI